MSLLRFGNLRITDDSKKLVKTVETVFGVALILQLMCQNIILQDPD